MKDGLKYLIGKRIAGVVVATSKRTPKQQVILVFSDGSRFEFHGENFSCCSGLDDGRTIQRYVDSGQGEIVQVYDGAAQADSEPGAAVSSGTKGVEQAVAPPESLAGRMKRDLDAWTLAKAVIEKARCSDGD